jgi:phosphoglycerate kinase
MRAVILALALFAGAEAFAPSSWTSRRAAVAVDAKKSVADLSDAELKGKKVLVRCDLNVPFKKGTMEIDDDTRVRASVATIKYLLDKGCKVAACSHLGRPKGGYEAKFSLAPCATRMGEYLKQDVKLVPDCIGPSVEKMVGEMKDGELVILENTRFYAEEEGNDAAFTAKLAKPFDMFVNDAFGTAHRAHASTEGVTKFLKPSVAGFLLDKELQYLDGAIKNGKKPLAAIVGGSKVSSKITVLTSLIEKCDKVFIGGGMVFTFLAAQGLKTGSSLVEKDYIETAKAAMALAKSKGCELILPVDIVVADKFAADAKTMVVKATEIPDGWMGLDNGPLATADIKSKLADCKTVIWNGPMGVFEFEAFAAGTNGVATTLAEITKKGAITIIGGGDSVSAVEKAGLADQMSHMSTGGGASLELLEGKVLPGVAALEEK